MPRLVVCHCDPKHPAYAVCERCERAELHAVLVARGLVADNPVVAQAYDVLAGAYLDSLDEVDRARDAADAYRLAVGE